MKEITRAQEEIMRALWNIKEGVVNDVLDQLQETKPAYNTVSTVIRVLEKKHEGKVINKIKYHIFIFLKFNSNIFKNALVKI